MADTVVKPETDEKIEGNAAANNAANATVGNVKKQEGNTAANSAKNPVANSSGNVKKQEGNKTVSKNLDDVEKKEEPSKFTAVSRLDYWTEGDIENNNANSDNSSTKYLSYTTFTIISVLGGFLALDHLYLRSPMTFVAKLFVNVTCFGVWWIWDAAQALFNEPVVRMYGLSIPGLGPKGIGAGVLVQEKPDNKHLRFFIYAVALIFGGLIGLDSFVLGQTNTGIVRLLGTLTIALMPVSALEWVGKLYDFFFNTQKVVAQYGDYFGAKQIDFNISGIIEKILDVVSNWINNYLQTTFGPVITPITTAVNGVTGAYNKTLDILNKTIKAGSDITSTVKKVVDAASDSATILPPTSLYSAVTTPVLQGAKEKIEEPSQNASQNSLQNASQNASQKGGADANNIKLLPFTLLGTILLIFLSGLYKNFIGKKNDAKDDSPPQPQTVRTTS